MRCRVWTSGIKRFIHLAFLQATLALTSIIGGQFKGLVAFWQSEQTTRKNRSLIWILQRNCKHKFYTKFVLGIYVKLFSEQSPVSASDVLLKAPSEGHVTSLWALIARLLPLATLHKDLITRVSNHHLLSQSFCHNLGPLCGAWIPFHSHYQKSMAKNVLINSSSSREDSLREEQTAPPLSKDRWHAGVFSGVFCLDIDWCGCHCFCVPACLSLCSLVSVSPVVGWHLIDSRSQNPKQECTSCSLVTRLRGKSSKARWSQRGSMSGEMVMPTYIKTGTPWEQMVLW